jgi:hypothetical protein
LNIVCLSTKGAGPRLTLDFATIAKQNDPNIKIFVSSKNELLAKFKDEFNTSQLNVVPINPNPLLAIVNRVFNGRIVFNRALSEKFEGSNSIFFPMASMWDYYLSVAIREKYRIIRIIHDGVKHKGDMLQFNFMIKTQYRQSDRVVCLSNFTANVLRRKFPKIETEIEISQHPVFGFVKSTTIDKSSHNYVLLLGRNKKYQNFRRFIEFWEQDAELVANNTLVVAGRNVSHVQCKTNSVNFVDHWLSESEISQLIANCQVAVFPYSEASQSGLIPIAKYFNKPIVFFPVGGLEEQVINYPLAEKAENFSEMMAILKNQQVRKIHSSSDNWKVTWKSLEYIVYKEVR